MDKSFADIGLSLGVGLGCKSHQSLFKQINAQRVEAGDQHVETQIILESPQSVGSVHILAHEVP